VTDTTSATDSDAPQAADEAPEWLSLDDGETLQWVGEPVPVSIVGTAVWGVLLTVVLLGFLILLTLPFSWLSIENTDYVVTDEALYVKKGVVSTNIESVGLDKIQNTEYSQSFWGKQFDFGSIDISTAGSSGAEISLQNVADARHVREMVSSLSTEYASRSRRSGADGAESATASPAVSTRDQMDELIDEVRATRQAMERIEQHLETSSPASDGASADEEPSN
jgi:Predicted membrane protein